MERRKHPRYKWSDNSFVTHADTPLKIGRIVDISLCGLAFHYLNPAAIPGSDTLTLGLLLEESRLFLPNVPMRTISDIQVKYQNPLKQIPLRRRGICFCEVPAALQRTIEAHCYLPPRHLSKTGSDLPISP